MVENTFHWHCTASWKQSARNTAWCLFGCSLGDFSTIAAFQQWAPDTAPLLVASLAIVNGILTSIAVETLVLLRQLGLRAAFRTAVGMSLLSMVAMELAMNVTDYLLVGGLALRWWTIGPMLAAGFLTAWPYNYWRLKKLGRACH